MLGEFDLIEHYFAPLCRGREDVALGIGDDAAILQVPADRALVVTVDTLVAGIHFPESADPASIGHKTLAVNLSDLAAMGAEPAWVTLALTLPEADSDWLTAYAAGFARLAKAHRVALVGGDTTHGPLSITVQAMGLVAPEKRLLRAAARAGDHIFVTGTLGDAALGLALALGEPPLPAVTDEARTQLLRRLHCPEPRVAVGQALGGLAHAAIDISDGLVADLGHILAASGTGATVDVDAVPRSAAFESVCRPEQRYPLSLSAGDDYELCFTVAPENVAVVRECLARLGADIAEIGRIEAEPGLRLQTADGHPITLPASGYDHFGGGAA